MIIKPTLRQTFEINAPLKHADHALPKTRRELISQGFMAGTASVFGSSVFSLFANPNSAHAALSSDLEALKSSCGIAVQGAGKVPFICFDLAGEYCGLKCIDWWAWRSEGHAQYRGL